ncbi:hypothetical protein CKM354_001035600 [Cercospora kikuchii]|uniref:Uncharacterized protein n=1 Tax=Cercospora kikuchii TaxID=84275 RepID=A0A9P3CMJ2_9PEZI|nr:uncharacterized protein CKM354_001035600 [Cercospora kikuchii]GIZ47259.1 hypothetical protein CKM354_001035600 [Cercospora kikuchii]
MSVTSDTEYAVAATKVFGIPELLEIILIDVARSEIDSQPDPAFIISPFILRAVNRDFRNTIDGSAELLSFRLETQDNDPFARPEGYVRGPEFGPLFWLEAMTGLDCTAHSGASGGVMHICLLFHVDRECKRMKLRKDIQGYWRRMPCVPKPKGISRVRFRLRCLENTERNITQIIDFQKCDLGPEPTLGLVFDMMDAGETAAHIFNKSGGRFADL